MTGHSTHLCRGCAARTLIVGVIALLVVGLGRVMRGPPTFLPLLWSGMERAAVVAETHGLYHDGAMPLPHTHGGSDIAAGSAGTQPTALIFMSPHCSQCPILLRRIASSTCGERRIAVLVYSAETDSVDLPSPATSGLPRCIRTVRDSLGLLSAAYGVSSVPTVYVLAADRRVRAAARGLERSWFLLKQLL